MNKQRKKGGKAWVRRLVLVILGLALGINAYLANANGVVGNQLPMPFGCGAAVVLSGSMEPTLSKNDLIFLTKSDEVKVGDIVVYQAGNELIVHRVVALDGDTVVTQGDANNVSDEPFGRERIKGVVRFWIPYAGLIVEGLKTPLGVILALGLAFLLVEGSFRRQKEKDNQDLEAVKAEIRRLRDELNEEHHENP